MAVPAGAPPGAPAPASPKSGEASGSAEDEDTGTMQGFIRSQMLNILHPVADHVREVQEQVQQLGKRLGATDGRMDEAKVCLDQQHQDILALRKGLSLTDGQVDKLQSELGMTHREKERLHCDHEVTKSDLAKIAGNLRTSNVLLKAMQQKCEDLDGDVRSLQMGAAKLGRSLVEEAEKVAQTRELAEGLNSRHLDIVRNVNDLGRSGAETERCLSKLTQHCEKVDGAVKAEFGRVKEHLDSLEARLGTSQHDIQASHDAMRGLETQMRLLRASLDTDDGSGRKMDTLSNRLERTDTAMREHTETIDGVRATLITLQKLFHTSNDDTGHILKDLEQRVNNNTTHLEGLETAKEKLGEHVKKHDISLVKINQNLDAAGGHIDMLQLDLKGLQASHTDLSNKVELQRVSLSKTQSDLKHTDVLVDGTNTTLLALKDGLAAMDVTISKLGSRYDSCNRNIQGMSKGFADVSKHVSQGDHGLLPPKSPHTRRLPSLGPGGSAVGVAPS